MNLLFLIHFMIMLKVNVLSDIIFYSAKYLSWTTLHHHPIVFPLSVHPVTPYSLFIVTSKACFSFLSSSKPERQRCALWIKKLCDPLASGSGLMGRRNRNAYARLLLHMLRKGVVEGPFTYKPEAGSLKTLPTYMVKKNNNNILQRIFV